MRHFDTVLLWAGVTIVAIGFLLMLREVVAALFAHILLPLSQLP